jgi:hypothetical protein
VRFAIFLVFLLSSTAFAFSQSNPSRQKSFPPFNFNYLDGNGNVASIVRNFTVTMVETKYSNGSLYTSYAVDYDIYNRTWGRGQYGMTASNLMNANGNIILQNGIVVLLDRASCTYGGARHVHSPGRNSLPNYIDITSYFQLMADPVYGNQGPC